MVGAPGLPRRCGARQPGGTGGGEREPAGCRALPQQRPVRGAGEVGLRRAASGAKTEAQEQRTKRNPETNREALTKITERRASPA